MRWQRQGRLRVGLPVRTPSAPPVVGRTLRPPRPSPAGCNSRTTSGAEPKRSNRPVLYFALIYVATRQCMAHCAHVITARSVQRAAPSGAEPFAAQGASIPRTRSAPTAGACHACLYEGHHARETIREARRADEHRARRKHALRARGRNDVAVCTRALASVCGACRVQPDPSWPQCERARNGSSRKKLQEAQLSVTLGKGGRAQWHGARRADASRFRVTRVVYWTAELVADSAQHSQWRRSKALDSDAMVSVGRAERR